MPQNSHNISRKLSEICRRYEILDLYAFGSRAREIFALVQNQPVSSAEPGSDADIGILPAEISSWGPENKVKLAIELEDLFHVPRVDLVILPEADPFLAADIISGELLYTSDPDRQARYELFVLRRAGDLLPFKKDRIHKILEEGAR